MEYYQLLILKEVDVYEAVLDLSSNYRENIAEGGATFKVIEKEWLESLGTSDTEDTDYELKDSTDEDHSEEEGNTIKI